MNGLLIFARASRARLGAGLVTVGAGIAVAWGAQIPNQWIYPSVASAAPVALVCGISGTVLAAALALPRLEACEVTASRKLLWYRASLVLAAYVGCLVVAWLAALALASWWHLLPLLRSGIVLSAITFLASIVVDTRFVSAISITYALTCYFIGRGDVWWDVLLAHPTPGSLGVVAALSCVAGGAFAVAGARALPPEDEL